MKETFVWKCNVCNATKEVELDCESLRLELDPDKVQLTIPEGWHITEADEDDDADGFTPLLCERCMS